MIVAIDGPSGTGKSSVAQQVAKRCGFIYFDTGALYRLFALHFANKYHQVFIEENIKKAFESFDFDIKKELGRNFYFLNGVDVTDAIRQEKISEIASIVSKSSLVREKLLPFQRIFAKKESVVMEGRDIGTIVFPDAEIKIFLTADEQIRAKRRLDQLKSKFPNQEYNFDEILNDLKERDHQDKSRSCAPLKKAEDAELIDTSSLSFDEVVEKVIELVEKHKKK